MNIEVITQGPGLTPNFIAGPIFGTQTAIVEMIPDQTEDLPAGQLLMKNLAGTKYVPAPAGGDAGALWIAMERVPAAQLAVEDVWITVLTGGRVRKGGLTGYAVAHKEVLRNAGIEVQES